MIHTPEGPFDGALRAIGVSDPAIRRALASLDRREFVAPDLADLAEENAPLAIGHGQTISAPDVVGYMTQALGVGPGAKVLDVGTGSGFQAAVLAVLGCRVFSVEIVPALAREAAERLSRLGFAGVRVRCGDGAQGWPEEAPFDGIVVAAAPEEVPPALVEQLRTGARLVLPVGPEGAVQRLLVLAKRAGGGADRSETLAVRFVPMRSAGTYFPRKRNDS